MGSHRCEGSSCAVAHHIHEPVQKNSVRGDAIVDVVRICCRKNDVRLDQVLGSGINPDRDLELGVGGRELAKRLGDIRRDNVDARSGVEKSQHLARRYSSAADDYRVNSFTPQCDGQRAQRNCPRLSAVTRNTTYMIITLANVIADNTAARRA